MAGTKLSAGALAKTKAPGIDQWEIGDKQFTEAEQFALETAGFNLVTEADATA